MPISLPFNSIKEFRIDDLIHEGPYTLVFRGKQTNLKRDVLIKLLKPNGNDDLKKRFEREARVYARLSHPNIVSVFDFGEKEKYLYIVLEYIHGTNLQELLKYSTNIPHETVFEIGVAVLSALTHAAKKSVIHRDIKPANILIDLEGRVKVADFGLAMIGDEPNLTQQQAMIGTPAYMSPEQITGYEIDERSDLFSFGAMIYELIFKAQAFGSENYSTCINNILSETPLQLKENHPEIPQQLISFLNQCLQKSKNDRFENVNAALKEWQKLEGLGKNPDGGFLVKTVRELNQLEADRVQQIGAQKNSGAGLDPNFFAKNKTLLLAVFLVAISLFWWFLQNGKPDLTTEQKFVDSTRTQTSEDTTLVKQVDSQTAQLDLTISKKGETEELSEDQKNISKKNETEPVIQKSSEPHWAQLDLMITPWAKVFIDSVLIDTHLTKKQIPLIPGEHVLTFEHPRFPSETQVVKFTYGELTQVKWSFWDKTGFLELEVRPWAHVYINDEFYDTTPINKPIRIPVGQKILELRHPELLNHREIIGIKAADTLRKRITLKISAGTVIDK